MYGVLPLVWGEVTPGRGHDVFFVYMFNFLYFCVNGCVWRQRYPSDALTAVKSLLTFDYG